MALPDLPTVSEFLPGYEVGDWFGAGAPKGTPLEIVDKLNEEINAGLADPKIKARLADLGGAVLAGSPADFGKFVAADTEKWGKVIKTAGISSNNTLPLSDDGGSEREFSRLDVFGRRSHQGRRCM
jgi:tripartite-type tricarboxylate transporter receptor subunit TctC